MRREGKPLALRVPFLSPRSTFFPRCIISPVNVYLRLGDRCFPSSRFSDRGCACSSSDRVAQKPWRRANGSARGRELRLCLECSGFLDRLDSTSRRSFLRHSRVEDSPIFFSSFRATCVRKTLAKTGNGFLRVYVYVYARTVT